MPLRHLDDLSPPTVLLEAKDLHPFTAVVSETFIGDQDSELLLLIGPLNFRDDGDEFITRDFLHLVSYAAINIQSNLASQMKFGVLTSIIAGSVYGRIRDRNDGQLKLNDNCVPNKIMKRNRCGNGLRCDDSRRQCKVTSGGNCTITEDCLKEFSCSNGKCVSGPAFTAIKIAAAMASPTEEGDGTLGSKCKVSADCNEGLVCLADKQCGPKPSESEAGY